MYFGLSSAILAPTGISLITYAINSKNTEMLNKLSSVSEIEDLMKKAKNEKERIQILETERKMLENTIRLETKRQILLERRSLLEREGSKLLLNIDKVDKELQKLNIDIEDSAVKEQIEKLHNRINKSNNDKVIINIGNNEYEIDTSLVRAFNPLGEVGYLMVKIANEISKAIFNSFNKEKRG
ncbi:hypothetical protein [Orenia marismortui]|uniref:hypothetical protein n=1 Tax=Orenia marismortui TaxID=46469 RepID=UPI00035C6CB9|nr:hypothetical protein [Orenia marismortui]